jgi:LacI family transcriptional regulator
MKTSHRDLGVSLMTVSKALRSHSDISDATRQRVLKRMRELNYQPDWIARSMAIGRTYLVGLAHPDLMHSFSFRREVDCSDTEIRETTGVLR